MSRLRRPLPQKAGFANVKGPSDEGTMPLTEQEKELLAERVVAVLKSAAPDASLQGLRARVEAGDEGEDGMNSVVLAIATAILRRGLG